MLKKIMKAALAASLVFGMSSFAYAQDLQVGGSFKEYFGQYNSGATGYSAHFINYGEANLQFKGTNGNASVFFEIQSDSGYTAGTEVTDVQRKVSYKSPIGQVSIGTVVNVGTVPIDAGSFKTSKVAGSTRKALLFGYKESDAIDLVVPLEGMGFVQATMYSQAGAGFLSGISGKGSVTQLGANLNFSGIGVRLGYSADTKDDPAISTDGDVKSSSTLLGVKVPIGDMMAIAFNYANLTVKPTDVKHSTMDLMFTMKGVGPGQLQIGYDSWEIKDGNKYAAVSAVYDIMASKGAGYEFGYQANTTTPQTGSATTETVILGGIYANF